MNYLQIDGTIGEGGGSITRLAAGFSVMFNKPIHLSNIRANRTPPGLRLQHQLGLESLQRLTKGKLSPIKVGTTDLTFTPGSDWRNNLDVIIRTAGSIALLSQTIQTASIRTASGDSITVSYTGGGTFGMGAPDPYYLNNVTYQLFQKMGYKCHIDVKKNGYYPKGGAEAVLHIDPVLSIDQLKPLIIEEKGSLLNLSGIIACSDNLKKPRVAERIETAIINHLQKNSIFSALTKEDYQFTLKYEQTLNPGVGLSIWANYENTIIGTGTILGKRGVPSEVVGKNAATHLIKETSTAATVDSYAADQVIPLMVLCPENSVIHVSNLTSHLRTNIELLNLFHPREHSLKKHKDSWMLEYKTKK